MQNCSNQFYRLFTLLQ
jgi:hypothetical protein